MVEWENGGIMVKKRQEVRSLGAEPTTEQVPCREIITADLSSLRKVSMRLTVYDEDGYISLK